MDNEELEAKFKKPKLKDLTIMSVEGLEEYIDSLAVEIDRARDAIKVKKAARQGAESVFKS